MVEIDPNKNPFPIYWPTKNTMPTIDPKQLIDHMAAEGVMALWEMASRCPCSADSSRMSPNLGCPTCKGKGWVYHNEQETVIEIQQMNKDIRPIERAFVWESGDVMMTMRAEHCPCFMDRITLLDSRMIISKTMQRTVPKADTVGETAYENLSVPIFQRTNYYRNELNVDTPYTVDVIRIQAQDPDTLWAGSVLERDVDFTVEFDANGVGTLNWAIGDLKNDGHGNSTSITPEQDGLFAITYITRPVYRVKEYTHTVRDTTHFTKAAGGKHHAMPIQFRASLDVDLRDTLGGVGD
jgi:hypothetical protein